MADRNTIGITDSVGRCCQLAIAFSLEYDIFAISLHENLAFPVSVLFLYRKVFHLQWRHDIEIIVHKETMYFIGLQFLMAVIRYVFDKIAEIFPHFLWHADTVIVFHDETYATFAGLAVDADDISLVLTAHIFRINEQVRHGPVRFAMIFTELHAFGNGILMGTGKCCKYQFSCIRLPFIDMHPRHPFIHFDNFW